MCIMSGKARKSLKFLKKTERRELINSVQEKKELFSIKLTTTLNKEYESYLKHFPTRSSVFKYAISSVFFTTLAKQLFDTLVSQYNKINKGGAKYSRFQLEWYSFSGKCLDKHTNSETDVILRDYEREILANVPLSADKDIIIYISCRLRSSFSCFQQLIIDLKSENVPKRKIMCSSESFDDTFLYRIAGAALRKMLKKRYSAKFFTKLSIKRQNITKEETKLVKLLCFKKTEKQKHIEKLPVGFKILDKGGLLVVKPRVLNFVRHFSSLYRINVNSTKYTLLGSQMLKLARIVVVNSQTTKSMFFDCSRHVSGTISFSDSVIQNFYKEFTEKLFNTLSNEFLKKLKFLSVNKAQVMLRDKLKVLAFQKQKKKMLRRLDIG